MNSSDETLNKLQNKVINLFIKKLIETNKTCDLKLKNTQIKKISINLEKSSFNYTIDKCKDYCRLSWDCKKFENMYKRRVLTLIANIDPKECIGNDYLIYKIISKKITFETLTLMSGEDLFPKKKLENEKIRCSLLKDNKPKKPLVEGFFKCGKCKSKYTEFYEMQTRSADEPMTAFITCLNCGKQWKQ